MLKNKLDYKLVNFLLILLIILTIYQTKELWLYILNIIGNIFKPLLISIVISYVLNIYLRILNKRFSKGISIIFFLVSLFLMVYILIFKLFGTLIIQLKEGISGITYILKTVSLKYNIDIIDIITRLKKIYDFIPNMDIITNIIKYITLTMIIISVTIYLFIDWNKIKNKTKELLKNKKNMYSYISIVNKELENYTKSFLLLSIINMIEYMTIFVVIKHPNYLLLGLLAGILSIIPMIGGITVNIIALALSFITNYRLFIRTIIGILILSILDGYIISPLVYNKSNKIHPIVSIISIYIGSKMFGLLGTIFSLPFLIIVKATYNYMESGKKFL